MAKVQTSFRKSSNLSAEQLQRALQVAKRAAAIDTGAIEGLYDADRGFTYTVAFETTAWETAIIQKGDHVRSLFTAQLDAYNYVLDFATQSEPISEAAIRTLHEIVCRAQDTYHVITAIGPQEQPLPKGRYKVLPNHVRSRNDTDYSYAPVDLTPSEMQRLVNELRTPAFAKAHPAIQAAYVHYGLVAVHPFADGNGRVARALASVFTYRAISMPLVIFTEQKGEYFNALENADDGKLQPFVDFTLDRLLDTMNLVEDSIKTAITTSPDTLLDDIQKLYLTRGGFTDEQVDAFGIKLLNMVHQEFMNQIRQFKSQRVNSTVALTPYQSQAQPTVQVRPRGVANPQPPRPQLIPTPPQTHRALFVTPSTVHLTVSSTAPASSTVTRRYALFVPKDAGGDDDITLLRDDRNDSFDVRIDDLQRPGSAVFQFRVSMFVERALAGALAQLKTTVASTMKARR